VLLWLWCRPAGAAPIRPLAWELPYTTNADLKRKKKNQQTRIIFAYLYLFSLRLTRFLLSLLFLGSSLNAILLVIPLYDELFLEN